MAGNEQFGSGDLASSGKTLPASKEYVKVRSWYLARLRRVAIDKAAATQLTPAALIAADKELVERLVLEKVVQQGSVKQKRPHTALLLGSWILLVVASFGWLFVLEGFDAGSTVSAYFRLTFGALVGQGPDDLINAGLPGYFTFLPVAVIGWPFWWLVIAPLLNPGSERGLSGRQKSD
jgi:hypothetical protein